MKTSVKILAVSSALFLTTFSGCMGPAPRIHGEVGRGANLWPLLEVNYEKDGRNTDILWPLLAFDNKVDHKYYAFRPALMVRTDPGDHITDVDALFPFFHVGRTGERREFACRPIFGMWRDPEKKMIDIDFLWPVGYYRSEPGKTWFHFRPIYWYKNTENADYFHLFPLFGENRHDEETRTWILTPLFTHWTDEGVTPPDWSTSIIWPLAHFEEIGDRTRSWCFPFFLRSKEPNEELLGVTPFFWDHTRRSPEEPTKVESRTRLILPLYGYHRGKKNWEVIGGNLLILETGEEEGSVNVLWPLFHHGWSPDTAFTWLFPVFWRFKSPDSSFLCIPPCYQSSGKDRRAVGAWPLFGYREKKEYREVSTMWPFFLYGSDGEEVRNLTLGGPLFTHSRKSDENWSWSGLLWLLSTERSGPRSHSRFFPFYLRWRNTEHDSRHLHLLWPLFRHKQVKDEISFRLLLPYMTYREKGEEHDFRIFWKWVRSSKSKDLSTFRINPFFRSDRNAAGDKYWSVLGGLVSRKTTAGEVDWRIFWFLPL